MNTFSKAEKSLKNGDASLELLIDLFQEKDIASSLTSVIVPDVSNKIPDQQNVMEYLSSVVAHKESTSSTKGFLSLNDYIALNNIEMSEYSDEKVTTRRLSEHETVKNVMLKGPALPLLNILSAVTDSSSISKVDIMQRPNYFYLSTFESLVFILGQLNDMAKEVIADGQYKGDETRTILSKHNLHIHIVILSTFLNHRWLRYCSRCG